MLRFHGKASIPTATRERPAIARILRRKHTRQDVLSVFHFLSNFSRRAVE